MGMTVTYGLYHRTPRGDRLVQTSPDRDALVALAEQRSDPRRRILWYVLPIIHRAPAPRRPRPGRPGR